MMSRDWIGFYNYGDGLAPHTMELSLSSVGTSLTGRGIDDIGQFSISGTCNGEVCFWVKTYPTHRVDYQGYVEQGRIWGTWTAGLNRGGFELWPKKGNEAAAEEKSQLVVGSGSPMLSGGNRGNH